MSENYAPPPGPPPGYREQSTSGAAGSQENQQQHVSWSQQTGSKTSELSSNNPFRNAHMNTAQGQPPSNAQAQDQYLPPPGPPPSWKSNNQPNTANEEFQPPPGPPPSYQQPHKEEDEPPPYDPWLAVPDTALLPPPPSIREERSPTANATWDEAAKGHAWCDRNPLWAPRRLNQQTLSRISQGDIRLTAPPSGPNSKQMQVSHTGQGKTSVKTTAKCTDTVFLSDIPLYSAAAQSFLQGPMTIYYELCVISMGTEKKHSFRRNEEVEGGIAIGFLAPPYPAWRLPGWHRASLAVHGDDGRRYIDNSLGGVDFTSAFRKNDIVGIGMTFSPPQYQGQKPKVDAFFTRNGKREGGWNLHEERDKEDTEGNVFGLEGTHDLLAAVGCFGEVEFEVRMRRADWKFMPPT